MYSILYIQKKLNNKERKTALKFGKLLDSKRPVNDHFSIDVKWKIDEAVTVQV